MIDIEDLKFWFSYDEENLGLVHNDIPREFFGNTMGYARHHLYVGKRAGSKNNQGYVQVRFGGSRHKVHRLVWLFHHGYSKDFDSSEVDHINGDRADNRISNLRLVNKSLNQRNAAVRKDNKSGFTGIYMRKGRWQVYSRVGGAKRFMGSFKEIEQAVACRNEAYLSNGYVIHDRTNRNFRPEPQSSSRR